MVVKALRAVSSSQNGVGAFVLQCKRLDFHYCDWAGSSKGMIQFIRQTLPKFAKENPQIEITVSPRPSHHPCIRGHYMTGKTKTLCVRNLENLQILKKADELKNHDGKKLKRVTKPVSSTNESVRGIWSGLHGHQISIGLEGLKLKLKSKN